MGCLMRVGMGDSMTFEQRLAQIDKMIISFQRLAEQFPNGIYGTTVVKLQQERTELVDRIGRKAR